jgi:cold shock CspA family protein
MNGKMKKPLEGKDFGFIGREGGEKDIFFHKDALQAPLTLAELKEGDELAFDIKDTPRGPAAENVRRA